MEANILVLIMNIGGGGAARDGRESPRLLRHPAVNTMTSLRNFHIEDEKANLTLLMSNVFD